MNWGRLITPQTAVILCFNAHIRKHKKKNDVNINTPFYPLDFLCVCVCVLCCCYSSYVENVTLVMAKKPFNVCNFPYNYPFPINSKMLHRLNPSNFFPTLTLKY